MKASLKQTGLKPLLPETIILLKSCRRLEQGLQSRHPLTQRYVTVLFAPTLTRSTVKLIVKRTTAGIIGSKGHTVCF